MKFQEKNKDWIQKYRNIIMCIIICIIIGLIIGLSIYFTTKHENFEYTYKLIDNLSGDDLIPNNTDPNKQLRFYTGKHGNNGEDPTHGSVKYGEYPELISKNTQTNRIKISAGGTIGENRKMVRMFSKKSYNDGLFVISADHIPEGMGVWPSFWLTSENNWACNGEIDIIEGVNSVKENPSSSKNHSTLHTSDRPDAKPCRQNPANVKGISNGGNCNAPTNSDKSCGCDRKQICPYSGCGVVLESTKSFGYGFNQNGGGVYAMELTPEGSITIWFFEKNSIPKDLINNKPNPSTWPSTNRTKFDPCPGQFSNLNFIVNTTLCGDWAGGSYPGGINKCKNDIKVADLSNAYWSIEYIKVFKRDKPITPPITPPSSSPTCYSDGMDPYGDHCKFKKCCDGLELCFNNEKGKYNYTCQKGPCKDKTPLPSCSKVSGCKPPLCNVDSAAKKLFRITGLDGKYIDLDKNHVVNYNSGDQKQKGCWSLDTDLNWKKALKSGYNCAAISISLPDDVKVTTYTSSGRWDGLCNQQKLEDIPAGVQNYRFKGSPCGFLFTSA